MALAVTVAPAWASKANSPHRVAWTTYGFDAAHTGFNPNETVITPKTAPSLHLRWGRDLGSAVLAQPVVATGVRIGGRSHSVAYEGTEAGRFAAIDVASGKVVWSRRLGFVKNACEDLPNNQYGVSGAAVIDPTSKTVYAAGGDGSVHAMALASGHERSGWPVTGVFDPVQLHSYGGLTLDTKTQKLYVAFASYCDIVPYHGNVSEIDIASRSVERRFFPAGRHVDGGGIWGPGGVSIDTATHHVFAATGNALTTPESYRYSENVVELSSSLRVLGANYPGLSNAEPDRDFGATPLLYDPPGCPGLIAAMNKTGELFLYRQGHVSDGPFQRIQVAANDIDPVFIGIPAYSPLTNMVYVTNPLDSPGATYRHGLVAFRVRPDCHLSLAWQRTYGGQGLPVPPPTVARNIVYTADGVGQTVRAFGADGGKLLWSSGSTIGGLVDGAPTAVNGNLLVPSFDGKLYCFGV